jgi:hypothetical protein
VSAVYATLETSPGSDTPLPIDLDEAETTAVVVLTEPTLVRDPAWVGYLHELAERTEAAGLASRLFPVALERDAPDIKVKEEALRWDLWVGTGAKRSSNLSISTAAVQAAGRWGRMRSAFAHPTATFVCTKFGGPIGLTKSAAALDDKLS